MVFWKSKMLEELAAEQDVHTIESLEEVLERIAAELEKLGYKIKRVGG